MTRGEKSWEELTSGFTIGDKRSEAPEKSMEVCRSSYSQTLPLDPIALHFLNLETSATRLARVLLVGCGKYVEILVWAVPVQRALEIWGCTGTYLESGQDNGSHERKDEDNLAK